MAKVEHDSPGEKAQQAKFNETLKRMLKTPPKSKQETANRKDDRQSTRPKKPAK